MPASDRVIFTINVNVKEARQHLNKLSSSFKGFDKMVKLTVKSLKAVYKELEKSVNVYRKFEDELIVVRRTASLTEQQMNTLGDAVRDAAIKQLDGAISAKKMATALGIAGQQGWISREMFEKNAEATTKFATSFAKTMSMMDIATDMTLPQAAKQLGMIHNIFKGAPEDIERLGSTINHFGNTMNVGQGIIAETTKRLSLYASNAGLSESSTVALAASMVNLGLTARQAGTSTGKMIQKMTTNYADFAEVFQLNASKFKKLVQTDMESALVMLAKRINELKGEGPEGVEGINTALKKLGMTGDGVTKAMLGLGSTYESLIKEFNIGREVWSVNNSLIKETRIASTTLSKRLEGVWNRFDEIRMMIGGPIAKVMSSFIYTDVYPLLDSFREWLKNSKFIEETWPRMLQKAKLFFITVIAKLKKFMGDQDAQKALFDRIKAVIDEIITAGTRMYEVLTSPGAKIMLTDMWNILKWIGDAIAGAIKNWYLMRDAIKEIIGLTIRLTNLFSGLGSAVKVIGKIRDKLGGDEAEATSKQERKHKANLSIIKERQDRYRRENPEEFAYTIDPKTGEIVRGEQKVKDLRRKEERKQQETTYKKITKAIDKTTQSAKKLKKEVGGIRKVTLDTGEVAYVNSVWPDMNAWVQKNIQSVGGLNEQLKKTKEWLAFYSDFRKPHIASSMLAESNIALQRRIQALTNFAGGLQHQMNLEAGKTQAEPGRKIQGSIVNINFNGTNIVDEASQEKFARTIGGILQSQNALLVKA